MNLDLREGLPVHYNNLDIGTFIWDDDEDGENSIGIVAMCHLCSQRVIVTKKNLKTRWLCTKCFAKEHG